ncbi:hypothetical protein J2Y46_001248 [Microbacterium sp. BE35]|uniref:hypothetical protein n=1 Tax=Microbacterium sp. BE35 TaxID=2817773 RepID=UPI002863D8F0|nr:hypothetical protein [Microbacterium sp. BE35]MDR7188432.1 hypothetical protein [Microbacterium sp. BE35]
MEAGDQKRASFVRRYGVALGFFGLANVAAVLLTVLSIPWLVVVGVSSLIVAAVAASIRVPARAPRARTLRVIYWSAALVCGVGCFLVPADLQGAALVLAGVLVAAAAVTGFEGTSATAAFVSASGFGLGLSSIACGLVAIQEALRIDEQMQSARERGSPFAILVAMAAVSVWVAALALIGAGIWMVVAAVFWYRGRTNRDLPILEVLVNIALPGAIAIGLTSWISDKLTTPTLLVTATRSALVAGVAATLVIELLRPMRSLRRQVTWSLATWFKIRASTDEIEGDRISWFAIQWLRWQDVYERIAPEAPDEHFSSLDNERG